MAPDQAVLDKLNNFIGYCLGVCLERYSIKLHAACYISNHKHEVVTDTLGELPAFKDTLNAWLARGINALRGRSDRFWSADEPVDVRSCEPLDIDESGDPLPREDLDDLLYVLANPVKHGLVRRAGRWPGFTTAGWKFGETRVFERPDWFFDAKNRALPDRVEITLERPRGVLPELDDEAFFEHLTRRVHERECRAQARLRRENRRFMGEAKVLRMRWNRPAASSEERFTMSRRVHDRDGRIVRRALTRDVEWRVSYAEARERLRRGDTDAVFPFGSYWLVRFAGARVERAPP